MGQLKVMAIDARLETGPIGLLLSLIRGARWELTCGFCKERFRKVLLLFLGFADCPYCGTRNLLPSFGPRSHN